MKRVDAKLKESKKLVWGLIVNCIVYFKKQQVSLIMNGINCDLVVLNYSKSKNVQNENMISTRGKLKGAKAADTAFLNRNRIIT